MIVTFSWFHNIPVFYSVRLVFLQKNRSHKHTSSSSVRLKMTNSNREVWGYILWAVYVPVSLVSHPLWFQWGGEKYLFTICKHHTSSIHAPISPVPHSLSPMHHPTTLHLLPPLSILTRIFGASPFSNCAATHHLLPPTSPHPPTWSLVRAYQDPGRAADYAGSCQPFQVRPPRRQFNCFRLRLCHWAWQ